MKPNKKCICKKCEDCNLLERWDMEDENGLRKSIEKCGLLVLFEEIPKIRGAIDGLQTGVNEARNKSMESKELTLRFAEASTNTLEKMNVTFVNILKDIDRKMIGN